MSTIEIKNVSKRFKETVALDNVTLTLEENKIYGLLGRNGAGKSTLLNIISNRVFADNGEVLYDGEVLTENDRLQKNIYLMSEKSFYSDNLNVKQIFAWTKEFYPDFDCDYAMKLSKIFGLNTKKKVKQLSTGYSSIFKLILALSVNTPFTFLDEPVLGLDANHRELFYKLLIETYAENPRTFVLSTHLIEEVSKIIEDIIIIKNGQIIRHESTEDLLALGYTVSGPKTAVDAYCVGRETIGEDTLGSLKVAYCLGQKDSAAADASLEFSPLDLQKLFVQLTNDAHETASL